MNEQSSSQSGSPSYLMGCRHIQKGIHDLKPLIGRISRCKNVLESEDSQPCVQMVNDAITQATAFWSVLARMKARHSEEFDSMEVQVRRVLEQKLNNDIFVVVRVLMHVLQRLLTGADGPTAGLDTHGSHEALTEANQRLCSLPVQVDIHSCEENKDGAEESCDDASEEVCIDENGSALIGDCILTHDRAVFEAPSRSSTIIVVLPAGAFVNVLKVVQDDEGSVYGAIKEVIGCAGYITLRNARLGLWCARRTQISGPTVFDATQQLATQALSIMASKMADLARPVELDVHSTSEQLKVPSYDSYDCGEYTLIRDAAVTKEVSIGSETVVILPAGETIYVSEVIPLPADERVRGLVKISDGLVGYVTLQVNHHVFVQRTADADDEEELVDDNHMSQSTSSTPHVQCSIEQSGIGMNTSRTELLKTTTRFASQAISLVATGANALTDHTLDYIIPKSLPDLEEHGYIEGNYVLIRDAAATEDIAFDSQYLGILNEGTQVCVLEVVPLLDQQRIRGRVILPSGLSGFITLRFAEHVFVKYAANANATSDDDELVIE